MQLGRGADAFRCEFDNRRFTQISQFNVGTVERLEIATVDRWTARSKCMVLRKQLVAHHGVIHHTCNLATNEISGGIVGLLVQQNVVVSQCKTKTQTVPRSFIRFLALFRCDIQSRGFVGHETQAGG